MVKQIEDVYERAEKTSSGFRIPFEKVVNELDRILENMPQEVWIPCNERKPESEKEVEITYVSKHLETGEPLYFTGRAFYEDGTINTEDSSFSWEDTDTGNMTKKKTVM